MHDGDKAIAESFWAVQRKAHVLDINHSYEIAENTGHVDSSDEHELID